MDHARRNDWMITQSLERSLEVISAINKLSINAKLCQAGVADVVTDDDLTAARTLVRNFVTTLAGLVEQAQKSQDRIALGADARLTSLARQFLSESPQNSGAGTYRLHELKDLETLLSKVEDVDSRVLIDELAHLRSALEQHSQADAAIVFDEV